MDIVESILQQAVESIKAKMQTEGINASGRTADSFVVRKTEDGWQLVGGGGSAAPVPTLEVGRQGGKVPAGFRHIIEQWSRDKGLTFSTESERRSFAYLTARKIAREGTARHKTNVDVYSSIVRTAADSIKAETIGSLRKAVVSHTKLHF